ncbi:MAG: hypothetical protein QM758_06415 [Armatimonas sp.]
MTAHRTLTRGIGAAFALVALITAAQADEVYSNFGPGDTFNISTGWTVSTAGSPVGGNFSVAGMFTASQNFTLTSFDIAAFHVSGLNSYLFSIVADNAGLPTGASLFSTSGSLAGPASVNSYSATGSLLAGNTYWLVMQPGGNDTWGAWNWNTTGATGFANSGNGGATWGANGSTSPTFRINGRPTGRTPLTPEMPAGVQAIPVLLAVGGMALYQRKKRTSSTNI